jgi:sugar phosphate isomerase/epimerase
MREMPPTTTISRELVATCWTWAGDAAPGRGDETSPHEMAERIEAVAEAGWTGVGIVAADLAVARDTIGLPRLASMLQAAGIRRVELEFLTDWWVDGPARAASDDVRALLFEASAELGAPLIKVAGQYDVPPVAWSAFVDAFGALAVDAAAHGARVAVEPMPMNNIRTIENGMRLVREVGHEAAGLCLDTQHVRRSGTDDDDLAAIIGDDLDRVFVVELDDSLLGLTAASPLEDAIDHRLYPGDGELDTARFVNRMAALGWTGPWGVEILSIEHRALPLREAVARAYDATQRVLDAAQHIG